LTFLSELYTISRLAFGRQNIGIKSYYSHVNWPPSPQLLPFFMYVCISFVQLPSCCSVCRLESTARTHVLWHHTLLCVLPSARMALATSASTPCCQRTLDSVFVLCNLTQVCSLWLILFFSAIDNQFLLLNICFECFRGQISLSG